MVISTKKLTQMFQEQFPHVRFRNFFTCVTLKTHSKSTTYIDFRFNIRSKKDCEALWLFFYDHCPETNEMYPKEAVFGDLPCTLFLNKREEIFVESAKTLINQVK